MDMQNPSAPPCAESRSTGKNSHAGVTHDNARHTTRFTVIGNHLAQHRELSLLAIGLAVHIQSLPQGARVDIKSLADRFVEGTARIAAGLRELETHGYLRRERTRVPGGRIVTRTVSCNQPGHRDRRPAADHTAAAAAPATPAVPATPATPAAPASPAAPTHATPATPATRKRERATPPRKQLPEVPRPAFSSATLLQAATDLLAGLRRHDPRLLLSATDTEHLTPGVAAWLERDVSPAAVRHALTADLPDEPLRRPAALLAHRLAAQLPPPPPFRAAPAAPPPPPAPLTNCDGCDRGIRSAAPDARCRECRTSAPRAD